MLVHFTSSQKQGALQSDSVTRPQYCTVCINYRISVLNLFGYTRTVYSLIHYIHYNDAILNKTGSLVENLHLAAVVLITVSAVSLSVHSKVVPPFIAELGQTVVFRLTPSLLKVIDI